MNHQTCTGMLILAMVFAAASAEEGKAPMRDAIVQFGKMHEAIGQQRHEGRVRPGELVERPHFFAVAALAGLQGEVTIFDGAVTVTTVDQRGQARPAQGAAGEMQATLLAGAYVDRWQSQTVPKDVAAEAFDDYIAELAAKAGLNLDEPFVFTVEGEFTDVRLHVINGACPVHARMKKIQLPPELRPFEREMAGVRGKVVGVFAKDAVGDLTHPATSTHVHLLYKDPDTGKLVTAHLEQLGMKQGSVVRLPSR
jgi:hypothetical protein